MLDLNFPPHWKKSKVGNHFDILLGKMLQPVQLRKDDTLENYLCAVNLGKNKLNIDNPKQMWFSKYEKKIYALREGDLLVVEGGDVASAAILDCQVDNLYFQNALFRVRPLKDGNVSFLKYWLHFLKEIKYIELICNKATIAHFTKQKFTKLLLPVPPLDEQEKIVRYLDKKTAQISTFVNSKQREVELLAELKRTIISDAVTKNSPHWQKIRLKYLATIKNGQDYKDFFDANGKYPVIGSGGEFARATKFLYDKPSVLLGRKGTINKPIYMTTPFWTVDTMYYTVINDHICPKFFYYLCTQIPFEYYQSGSVLPSMTQKDLYSILLPVPPIDEQVEIAAYLDEKCGKIDKLSAALKDEIKFVEELKTRIISDAVTGKLEVREVN